MKFCGFTVCFKQSPALIVFLIAFAAMQIAWSWGPPEVKTGNKRSVATYIDTINTNHEIVYTTTEFSTRQLVVPDKLPALQSVEAKTPNAPAMVVAPNAKGQTDGFRIQCFAVSSIERARAEQKNLEQKTGLPVYIKFESPYYKLHVGNFTDRKAADAQAKKIKELGYDGWIVKTAVDIQ